MYGCFCMKNEAVVFLPENAFRIISDTFGGYFGLMGLILGFSIKEKHRNLLLNNLLRCSCCGERGLLIYVLTLQKPEARY